MKNKLIILIFCFLVVLFNELYAQGNAGDDADYDSFYIVDMPTAGCLKKSSYCGSLIFFSGGGIETEFSVAPFKNFQIGLSYGGSSILGSGDIVFQKLPGIQLRVRLFEERVSTPAVLVGVNTQGKGNYLDDLDRFETISPGLYLALSKNYKYFAGNVAFHLGLTYSFEIPTSERKPSFYIGLEQSIGDKVSFNLELNPTLNEYNEDVMSKKILLNAALRWSVVPGVVIEFQGRDLFRHLKNSSGFTRNVKLEYISKF